jgi:hypothetical protein
MCAPEGSGLIFALARVRCVTSKRKVSGFTRFFQPTVISMAFKPNRPKRASKRMNPSDETTVGKCWKKKSVAKIFDVDCQAAKKRLSDVTMLSHAANPDRTINNRDTLRRRPSRRQSHRRHLVDEPFNPSRARSASTRSRINRHSPSPASREERINIGLQGFPAPAGSLCRPSP